MRAKRPDQPIPPRHFAGHANISPRQDDLDLRGFLGARATVTSAELHLYANSVTGDDNNDGLSALRAKATLDGVLALVPDVVKHNTMVHLSGTFTMTDNLNFSWHVYENVRLIITGETEWEDTGEGILTTTAGDETGLDVSGAGWAADEHAGHFIVVLAGDAAGEARMIQANDSDTVEPIKDFSVDPRGSGEATFRIAKPSTKINGTSNDLLYMGNTGGGIFVTQWLTFDVDAAPRPSWSHGAWYMAVVVVEANFNLYFQYVGNFSAIGSGYNSDFVINTAVSGGLACTDVASQVIIRRVLTSGINASVFKGRVRIISAAVIVQAGTRVLKGLEMYSIVHQELSPDFNTLAGFRPVRISNSGGVGLLMRNSSAKMDEGVDISNCSSHAIELEKSLLHMDGVVTGTSNVGAGVYAHLGSMIKIKNGSPPTLTGGATPGDLSTDGATEASTWAAIDAGTPLADTTEMVVAKEV
jgi:hypothetical protein